MVCVIGQMTINDINGWMPSGMSFVTVWINLGIVSKTVWFEWMLFFFNFILFWYGKTKYCNTQIILRRSGNKNGLPWHHDDIASCKHYMYSNGKHIVRKGKHWWYIIFRWFFIAALFSKILSGSCFSHKF